MPCRAAELRVPPIRLQAPGAARVPPPLVRAVAAELQLRRTGLQSSGCRRVLMATGGNGDDADVAIIAASSSAATSKGKGVPRASAAAKGKGIARESTNGVVIAGRSTSTMTNIANEVVCEDGRRVKLKGPIEYVWSHGERYKTNGFSCFYCTTAIAGGGATRFRQHLGGISGNVVACPKVPCFVKELMVDEVTKRNIRFYKSPGSSSQAPFDIDLACSRTQVQPRVDVMLTGGAREKLGKAWAKWFHANDIPGRKADCPYFRAAVKLSQELGDGVHIPRGKEIDGPLLDRNFDDVEAHLAEFKEDWNEYGVTIMCDSWTAAALDPKTIYTSKLAKSPKCKHAVTLVFKKLARSSSKASTAIDQYILFRKQGKLFGGEEARRSALNGRVSADNPIMDWLCNSRSESVLTLDEYVDSDLELEPPSPSTFIVEELGMDEAEVVAFKNRIFPKKSGKKRRLEFEEEDEEDNADDVESDSTQGRDDNGDIGRDCGEEYADGGPNNDGGAENTKKAPLRPKSKRKTLVGGDVGCVGVPLEKGAQQDHQQLAAIITAVDDCPGSTGGSWIDGPACSRELSAAGCYGNTGSAGPGPPKRGGSREAIRLMHGGSPKLGA
ncbi:uncharacterized protein C2845_PM07G40100 [Panicum miliaceum]|uniref:BED-type domain-containing protein n=1 Tax=Panicum miliaceum TaxID=4540 RepID=A0A3L6SJV7_PANMI|nr:uncharacterized protein C2845_PM07G40100 [Panicum miliaceum]